MNIKKIKYKVIDNFLSKKEHNEILKMCNSNMFPWYLQPDNSTTQIKTTNIMKKIFKNIRESTQFTHLFYSMKDLGQGSNKINSPHFPIIETFCKRFIKKYKIKKLDIFRAKANVQLQVSSYKKNNHNTPHKDFEDPYVDHNVLLYYVNDSDGDTHFFKENKIVKSVSPKANRLVVFDGNILHTGCHPCKSNTRIVINIDCIW